MDGGTKGDLKKRRRQKNARAGDAPGALAEEEAAPEVCREHTPWRVQVGAAHLAAAPTSFCRRLFIARNSNDEGR